MIHKTIFTLKEIAIVGKRFRCEKRPKQDKLEAVTCPVLCRAGRGGLSGGGAGQGGSDPAEEILTTFV